VAARVKRVFASELVAVDRVEHPARLTRRPSEYCATGYSINFVDRGTFALTAGRARWLVGRRDIFVTAPGLEYTCHEVDRAGEADAGACLDLRFAPAARAAFELVPVAGLAPLTPVISSNNRREYLRGRLLRYLDRCADALVLDLIAAELLHSAITDAPRPKRVFKPAQLGWYGRRIDEARHLLDTQHMDHWSLAALARTVGMSPFHFARIFGELVGFPPHRYLVRRRLEAAAARLRDGATVTETSEAVGFGSLSHFIHAFRAAYHVTPSVFRATHGGECRS
jgi:AraC family transcriptional regulator